MGSSHTRFASPCRSKPDIRTNPGEGGEVVAMEGSCLIADLDLGGNTDTRLMCADSECEIMKSSCLI